MEMCIWEHLAMIKVLNTIYKDILVNPVWLDTWIVLLLYTMSDKSRNRTIWKRGIYVCIYETGELILVMS